MVCMAIFQPLKYIGALIIINRLSTFYSIFNTGHVNMPTSTQTSANHISIYCKMRPENLPI